MTDRKKAATRRIRRFGFTFTGLAIAAAAIAAVAAVGTPEPAYACFLAIPC